MAAPVEAQGDSIALSLFCVRVGDAWRIHVSPAWLPPYLREFFDAGGEAFAVELDFDDLDRYMAAQGVEFEKSVSSLGGVELMARGRDAAAALGVWLSNAFASGRRPGSRSSNQ